MPSPPIILFCAAGIGLAALLYYFYAASEERMSTGYTAASDERISTAYAADSEERIMTTGEGRRRPQRQYYLEECTICQEFVYKSTSLHRLACGHGFHFRCIEKWLEASPHPQTCPNCRRRIR